MRTNQIVFSAIFLFSAAALAAAGDTETPKAYVIEAKLTQILPGGKEQVLSSPCLMTLEGREVRLNIGQNLAPPKGVTVDEPLRSGHYCVLKVSRKDDRLILDAKMTKSTSEEDEDGISIATTGAHIVKAITLGKKVSSPPIAGDFRWEVLVQDAAKYKKVNEIGEGEKRVSAWEATTPGISQR